MGNSGNGKSTLIKAIITEARRSLKYFLFPTARRVRPHDVLPHTAGIVPIPFNSKPFGLAVLYDFAGQHEYYSSHAAVMENLILPTPPLFLLLIDISKPINDIKEELVYWWQFINNHSQRAVAPPHVILVISHKDVLQKCGGNPDILMEQLSKVIGDKNVKFKFESFSLLDCRQLHSKGLSSLLTQLNTTCKILRETANVDLHCHILRAFLASKFNNVACQISEIMDAISEGTDVLLPQDQVQLSRLLSTLTDQGHVLLLKNNSDENKSWVVLKPDVLLREINGSIFCPRYFKEQSHRFSMEYRSCYIDYN